MSERPEKLFQMTNRDQFEMTDNQPNTRFLGPALGKNLQIWLRVDFPSKWN